MLGRMRARDGGPRVTLRLLALLLALLLGGPLTVVVLQAVLGVVHLAL